METYWTSVQLTFWSLTCIEFFYLLGPSYCLINISSGIYVLRIFNGCYGTHPMSRCRRWNPTGALTRSGTRISTNSYRWVESKSRMDERRLRTSSTLSSFQLLDKFSSFLSFSLQRYESFSRSLDNLPSQRESWWDLSLLEEAMSTSSRSL